MEKEIVAQYFEHYKKNAAVFAAPARVNLIGEHTDYNEGFVLPGAVDKRILIAIGKNEMNVLNVYAKQYDQQLSFSLQNIYPVKGWATYLLGIIFNIRQKGFVIQGIDVMIDGDIPLGAGMSS